MGGSTPRFATLAGARTENAAGVAAIVARPPLFGCSSDASDLCCVGPGPPLDSQVDRVPRRTISPVGKPVDTHATIASTYGNTTYGDDRVSAQVVATGNRPEPETTFDMDCRHPAVRSDRDTCPQAVP